MPLHWPSKDPGETVTYTIDWSKRLGPGETISSTPTWSYLGTDLTLTNPSNTSTTTKVTVAGGLSGLTYLLTNTLTTSQGQTLVENVELLVRNR